MSQDLPNETIGVLYNKCCTLQRTTASTIHNQSFPVAPLDLASLAESVQSCRIAITEGIQ